MIPLIGVTGKSGVGKTTLITALIAEFARRGRRVAAIKHTRHQLDLDRPGKDSELMARAGANPVALASPDQAALFMNDQEWTPEDLVHKLFPRVDLVLVEGFGDAPLPRIGLLRKGVSEEHPDRRGLFAVVADFKIESDLPALGFEQVPKIADLIEEFINRKGPRREVTLYVNEKKIALKPFIKDFFLNTISAMVQSLKDTEAPRRIQITIDLPE